MSDPCLITTHDFHGKEYLVKMNVRNGSLDLNITNKYTGEEWQCSYNASCMEIHNVYIVIILFMFTY